MRILLLIIFFFNFSCKESFDIKIIHDINKRESIIYLLKNNIKTDSIIVNDYYGKNKTQKLDDNLWSIEYSTRCGTGCISRNVILINQVDKKINIPLHMIKEYEDSISSKIVFIDKKVKGDLFVKLKIKTHTNIVINNNQKLRYDSKLNIYFNHEFEYKNEFYKGVKLDSLEFIFFDKKWTEFDSRINKVYYDF